MLPRIPYTMLIVAIVLILAGTIGYLTAKEKVTIGIFVPAGPVANPYPLGPPLSMPARWDVDPNRVLEVYASEEIDMIRSGLNQQIVDTAKATDQKIQAAESRMKDEVKNSVDALPQRLLTAEAKEVIKAAVLTELRGELSQLRQDLQKQIDEIRSR